MNFLNVFLFLSTVCIQPDAMAAPEDDERQESRIDVRILDNESWWKPIISGEYMDYYEKMYGNR